MQTDAKWYADVLEKRAAQKSDVAISPVGDSQVVVDLEVPEFWFTVAADGDRHSRMFAELCAGLGRRSLTANLSIVPFATYQAPRKAPPNGICISYHSVGDGPNIWRVKETSIVGWYSFDPNGFSGWSSLARFPEQHAAAIDAVDTAVARREVDVLRRELRAKNASKYAQSTQPFSVNQPFVYLPLQLLDDPVSQFYRFNVIDVMRYSAALAERTGQLLVVKRHPLCKSAAISEELERLRHSNKNVVVSDASIHEHLSQCRAVIVANSGVGLEAFLYGKPVFTVAASEYELGAYPCGTLEDIARAFAPTLPEDDGRGARFLLYYLSQCCFSIYNRETVDRCIARALSNARIAVPQIFATKRDAELRAFANAAQLQRDTGAAQAERSYMRPAEERSRPVDVPAVVAHAPSQPAANSNSNSLFTDAAARVALLLHGGGVTASVAQYIMTSMTRAAYSKYAELASALNSNPMAAPIIDAQLLRSEYASGLDKSVAKRNITAVDYQRLHDGDAGYQNNNWLVDHTAVIETARPGTIVEVGCGNGQFLRAIAGKIGNVIGLDWARSPLLGHLPSNVTFQETNVLVDTIPRGDLCCSADVLEHFEPHALPGLLRKLHQSAPVNYHVIACYDDGHSHCAVLHPGQWLGLFRALDPSYEIAAIIPRRGRPDQIVCVITNLPRASDHFPSFGPVVGVWETNTGQRVDFRRDFTVSIAGSTVAAWFPMPDNSAAVGWLESGMVDIVTPIQNGNVLKILNLRGEEHQVRRVG